MSVGTRGAGLGEEPQAAGREGGKAARRWLLGGVLALLVLSGLRIWSMANPAPQYGIVIDAHAPAADFTLDSTLGRPLSLSELRGEPVLLYFGYTTCPDICPTTLNDLHAAMEELGGERDKVQVVFVSVDPERDTAERLATYLPHFDPAFIGMTGALPEVEAVANRFGVFFEKNTAMSASKSAAVYLVDHTSAVLLLDTGGAIRLQFPYGTTGKQIAADTRPFIR